MAAQQQGIPLRAAQIHADAALVGQFGVIAQRPQFLRQKIIRKMGKAAGRTGDIDDLFQRLHRVVQIVLFHDTYPLSLCFLTARKILITVYQKYSFFAIGM
jgi:hypothetical protein